MVTRRSLLLGASAATIALVMPVGTNAPALDKEALSIVTRHIREGFFSWSERDRIGLVRYAMKDARTDVVERALSRQESAMVAVDRMLRVGFRSMIRERAQWAADGFVGVPLYKHGRLTVEGQLVLLYLPIAPSDYHPNIFPALDRLAPHYLA